MAELIAGCATSTDSGAACHRSPRQDTWEEEHHVSARLGEMIMSKTAHQT